MPFEKGRKKTGGRKKGRENMITQEIRLLLKGIVADEVSNLSKLFPELEPKQRVELLIKLLPYILPKLDIIQLLPEEWGDSIFLK